MRVAALLTLPLLLAACRPAPCRPIPPNEVALDSQLVTTATRAETVIKAKVRVDASGRITKQSVYHDDAASIPEAVRAAATERFPSATVLHYESEVYADRGRVYEVEVDDGGTKCELAATPEGVEVYVECHLDPASLSPEVAATVERVAPGGTLLEAETKKGPDIDELTIEVDQAGRLLYLRVKPDGTLIEGYRRIPGFLEVPLE